MITRIEAKRYRCLENAGIDIPRYIEAPLPESIVDELPRPS